MLVKSAESDGLGPTSNEQESDPATPWGGDEEECHYVTDSISPQQALLLQISCPASEIHISDPSGGTWYIHNIVQPPLIHLRSQHVHTPKGAPGRPVEKSAVSRCLGGPSSAGPATRGKNRRQSGGWRAGATGLSRPLAGTLRASQLPPTLLSRSPQSPPLASSHLDPDREGGTVTPAQPH